MTMPEIVYVDDEPDAFIELLPPGARGLFDAHRPGEGEAAFAAAGPADLWLFDYFYDDRSDQERPPGENGLSTFQKWRSAFHEDRPITAVVSNDLARALGRDIPASRAHLLAIRAGVEWVGPKTKESAVAVLRLAETARALSERVRGWLSGFEKPEERPASIGTEALCFELLAAPREVAWSTSIVRHVDRAKPPRLGAAVAPAGIARSALGWLLHAVLPYQSFLLTLAQAAVRLGVTESSLARARAGKSPLAAMLEEARYQGPLAELGHQRWWRGGIDSIVWQLSSGEEAYRDAIARSAAEEVIEFLAFDEPVLVCDADLVETGEVAEARDCVRAQSEDFPSDVPPAWVRIEAAREDRVLAANVIFEDRDLLVEARAA